MACAGVDCVHLATDTDAFYNKEFLYHLTQLVCHFIPLCVGTQRRHARHLLEQRGCTDSPWRVFVQEGEERHLSTQHAT